MCFVSTFSLIISLLHNLLLVPSLGELNSLIPEDFFRHSRSGRSLRFFFLCVAAILAADISQNTYWKKLHSRFEKKKEKSMLACSSQESAITRIEGWRMSFSQLPSLCAGQELSNNLRNRRKRPRQVKSRSAVVQKITRLSIYVWASPTSLNNKQGAGILATQLAGTIKISQLL